MTKEELLEDEKRALQLKIGTIECAISNGQIEISKYAGQLADLKKQHADLSKPKLTPQQMDKLQMLIEEAVESFDFDDTDNYSIEYGIDYNNRVTCESFCFDNSDEVTRQIMENIEDMFAEATDDSDNS
eukprot:GHVR01032587.1.p2 GENE.GHVR01032587.1~~GHVR01032587.1.p2  ORF type:complete len:129 (-),score=24.38 GHVR01032587.1:2323-2709(-)